MIATKGEARRYLLLLGSNIAPRDNLPRARARLARDLTIERWSRVYESDAVGAPGTPRFHNQAGVIVTNLDIAPLRAYCRSVEAELGRQRGSDPNAPRPIDLDIVLALDEHGDVRDDVPRDRHLETLHHVCVPAAELIGTARLPGRGPTVAELAARLGPPPAGFALL